MYSHRKSGMWRTLRRAVFIVLIGVVAGLVGNQISPRAIPLLAPPEKIARVEEFIALGEARELWSRGLTLFLDAREPGDYEAGHIGNALNLPALSFETRFETVAPMLTPASEMVIYCDGRECELSHRLAESLRQRGYTNTHMLFNGWTAWKQAGFPTTGKQ